MRSALRYLPLIIFFTMIGHISVAAEGLPRGFVYLRDVDLTIRQDMRYNGKHNFIGRPIEGYDASECILTNSAAVALKNAQTQLATKQLSLLMWDCYRPVRAVRDFVNWSRLPKETEMKAEFYPRTDKANLFSSGYITSHSRHSRGSTVDLGIVPANSNVNTTSTAEMIPCTKTDVVRPNEGTIDFGTAYDCFDALSNINSPNISKVAHDNRLMLRALMQSVGFISYDREWWHFELRSQPFSEEFNFRIVPRHD